MTDSISLKRSARSKSFLESIFGKAKSFAFSDASTTSGRPYLSLSLSQIFATPHIGLCELAARMLAAYLEDSGPKYCCKRSNSSREDTQVL